MEASLSPTKITRSSMLVKTPALVECTSNLTDPSYDIDSPFVRVLFL